MAVIRGLLISLLIVFAALVLAVAVSFDTAVVTLYTIGFVLSGLFIFTWVPLAIRALMHHARDVSLMRIVDYAGLQVVVFLAFALILRTVAVYGITPAPDALAIVSRLMLPLMLDVIIGLRLYKWGRRLWENRAIDGDPDMLERLSKDGLNVVADVDER